MIKKKYKLTGRRINNQASIFKIVFAVPTQLNSTTETNSVQLRDETVGWFYSCPFPTFVANLMLFQ